MKRIILAFFCCCLLMRYGYSQAPCSNTVTTFPYNENFENSDGDWDAGGASSDWTWGTPAKSLINGAGEGNRCWITGGLTGSSYNNGESAWLASPCFDFTNIQNPEISFKIFWETERRFDGANLQVSFNGMTWSSVGDINSNSNCRGSNWYNTESVTYAGNTNGWTGNIQSNAGSCLGGGGSGTWITARHTLAQYGGVPYIRFRFLFGAGTTCNNFDGFAIDDITIREGAIAPVTITNTCLSNNQLKFSATGNCLVSYSWDFGDPASGSSNTSTQPEPSHVFSAPGTYTVSLSAISGAGGTSTATTEVVVISASGITNWPNPCSNIPNATLSVTVAGSNTGYIYNWDTNPPQTGSSITNVGPGTYTVTVNAINACATSVVYILGTSTVSNSVVVTNSKCTADNGSIVSTASGGTAPYTYTWSTGETGASIQNLSPGTYSVEVTDAGGCSVRTENIVVVAEQANVPVNLGDDRAICNNETLLLDPGNFSSYLWQDGSVASTYPVMVAGNYSVQVTDINGCIGTDAVSIIYDCSDLYFPGAFSPDDDGRNDGFGALGSQTAFAKNYRLNIYNRYGQLIYTATDPLQKWDGTFKGGIPLSGSYAWMATYKLNGKERFRKGTILLIR